MSDTSVTLFKVARIFRVAKDSGSAFYHFELRLLPAFKVGAGWVLDMRNVPKKWFAVRHSYRFLKTGDWRSVTVSLWRLRIGWAVRYRSYGDSHE